MINRDSLPEQVKSVIASFEHEGCNVSDELVKVIIEVQNGGDTIDLDKFRENTKQTIEKYEQLSKQKTDSDET